MSTIHSDVPVSSGPAKFASANHLFSVRQPAALHGTDNVTFQAQTASTATLKRPPTVKFGIGGSTVGAVTATFGAIICGGLVTGGLFWLLGPLALPWAPIGGAVAAILGGIFGWKWGADDW